MDIVADSSTLILLAKVTLLKTFAEEKKLIITPMVKLEVFRKKEQEDAQIISTLLREALILQSERKAKFQKFVSDFNIGVGESEALAFAWNEKKILATDDWRAIKACKILGVKFITAIHCLLYLVEKGKLDKKMAVAKLKNLEKCGRYNSDIIKDAKNIIEGDNNG
ncbi:hypothetical protein J4207_04370 [Candidatus Woesearchaeota archaeon]|nr:hypothetical protein [Candidatus Woesearchaeota archaeon]